jgi:hypothetical protein
MELSFILAISVSAIFFVACDVIIKHIISRKHRLNFYNKNGSHWSEWRPYNGDISSIEIQRNPQEVLLNKSVSNTEEILKDKQKRFLNIANVSFHYANKDQITSFYNDYFKEPTIEGLVSEISHEISDDVKGNIPKIIEAKIGGSDFSKWISTIKMPDTSLNGMFLKYQKETIKNNQVQLGIEEVDIELTNLQHFEDAINDFQKEFDFKFDNAMIENQRAYLKEKAAERTIIKLEQASGDVLIEGKFRIEEIEGNFYKCTFTHPVNEYIPEQIRPITISLLMPCNSIESQFAGNYKQSVDKVIPMRVYGQVWQPIDRKSKTLDLQLTPLAVY